MCEHGNVFFSYYIIRIAKTITKNFATNVSIDFLIIAFPFAPTYIVIYKFKSLLVPIEEFEIVLSNSYNALE